MSQARPYPVSFTGTGAEYFRIWIVNIALTLVTLGIYSAWAKVRTQRWFYGHTWIDGHAFSYLASPLQILKGRLVAFGALALYWLTEALLPPLAFVLVIAFFLALPWVVVSALRFRARQSAYRGLRFDFNGGVGEAFRIYTLGALGMMLTFGLLFPYLAYRQQRFIAAHSRYGDAASSAGFGAGAFWKLYFKAGLFAVALFLVFGMLFGGVGLMNLPDPKTLENDPIAAARFFSVMLGLMATFYLAAPVLYGYVKSRTANLVYNGTQLAGAAGIVGFTSTQRARDLIWLYVSNVVGIALTAGLFIPWAKVRLARYRAEQLQVLLDGTPEAFSAGARQGSGAVGNEVADMFDIDVGFA